MIRQKFDELERAGLDRETPEPALLRKDAGELSFSEDLLRSFFEIRKDVLLCDSQSSRLRHAAIGMLDLTWGGNAR